MQLFSSIKSYKQSYCVRIHYLHNSSTGYFNVFRPSNIRIFNNLAISIKSPDDAIESLRSIVESFKVALSVKNISVPIFEGKLQPKKSKKPQTVYFAKKINQQLQKLPTTISDNNLLRFGRNMSKSALSNVSNQFARFKGKFYSGGGSTRSNINLPDVIYEMDNTSNDLRNNSCTSLSIVNEDTMDYVKTSLKPRLTDPSSITSSSSIALYTTTEEEEDDVAVEVEHTLSSEFSSTDDLEQDEEFSQNDEEDYSKIIDTNDTLLESCGILLTSSKAQQRQKNETGVVASDKVDDFVLDSMNKQSLNQMLNEVKRKACSPRIQINQDFRSSDCFLNQMDNQTSTTTSHHQSCTDGVNLISPVKLNLDDEDCTRSTMDIYSTRNTKRNHHHHHNPHHHSSLKENRIKSSKSETPLNNNDDDLNESTSRLGMTIGKRDLLFNPLSDGLSKIARGVQNMNISLISRRYNKVLLSNEELESLAERKNRSKSLIIEIE